MAIQYCVEFAKFGPFCRVSDKDLLINQGPIFCKPERPVPVGQTFGLTFPFFCYISPRFYRLTLSPLIFIIFR